MNRNSSTPVSRLTPLTEGGFRLEDRSGASVRTEPVANGWVLEGKGALSGMFLTPDTGDGSPGLVLHRSDERESEEVGRITLMGGSPDFGSDATLLTEDGRLFRIGYRRGPRPGFELASWELPEPFMIADHDESGWTIRLTPAGEELHDDGSIVFLFAAHLFGDSLKQ